MALDDDGGDVINAGGTGSADLNVQPRALHENIDRRVPFGSVQYLDVQFTMASVDTPVSHKLAPYNPNAVRYEVVRKDRPCDVYEDYSPGRKPWTLTSIFLRCNTASARVRLRLFTERNPHA